jgi:hypothetical protein
VGLRRGDGDGERKGKIWVGNDLGKKISIEWTEMGFENSIFFFLRRKKNMYIYIYIYIYMDNDSMLPKYTTFHYIAYVARWSPTTF